SDNPEREMSKLHSTYAWGVVIVVIISTLFLLIFGNENWQWLVFLWMSVPVLFFLLFLKSTVPQLKTQERASSVLELIKKREFIICFLCIFLGGASECTMSQWSSSYIEQSLNISKVWGDIFGVAMFALMLGLGRTIYSRYGKNIYKVLAISSFGATICYIVATVTSISVIGLISCATTGLCTAMLWPGSLIMASDKFPSAGLAVFALMAAGGDLGGSIGPQLVGVITDIAMSNEQISDLSAFLNITNEQLVMKIGLLSASIFPLLATILFCRNYIKQKQDTL
ncbi:MAG TPA: MFS transporter, partial [Bacillota bacterium]|nr:MFS transporter [Bacillota bacterium]